MVNGLVNGNGEKHHDIPDPNLLAQLRETYIAAGQSHVFTFYDSLSPSEQSSLLDQLANIDVHRVNRIYTNAVAADGAITPPTGFLHLDDTLAVGGNMIGRSRTPSPTPGPEEVLPLPDEACASILNNPADEKKWRNIGLDAIASNTVAVLLLAGGQGTRLGSSSPKGMYDIHLPSGMTLFEYQAGRLAKLEKVAAEACGKQVGSVRIRWYVMTSGPTRTETEQYFEQKGYFGLRRDDVIFFEQGELVRHSDTLPISRGRAPGGIRRHVPPKAHLSLLPPSSIHPSRPAHPCRFVPFLDPLCLLLGLFRAYVQPYRGIQRYRSLTLARRPACPLRRRQTPALLPLQHLSSPRRERRSLRRPSSTPLPFLP